MTTVGNADIKAQGVTRIEDITNSLPQVFAGQGSIDLQRLHRHRHGQPARPGLHPHPGADRQPPPDAGRPGRSRAADLNFIPAALVERVDVLTGGASAIYGADAVAGVVNFIMLKNFEGVRIDAQYSGYQHTNHEGAIQNVVRAAAAARQRSAASSPCRRTASGTAKARKSAWSSASTRRTARATSPPTPPTARTTRSWKAQRDFTRLHA